MHALGPWVAPAALLTALILIRKAVLNCSTNWRWLSALLPTGGGFWCTSGPVAHLQHAELGDGVRDPVIVLKVRDCGAILFSAGSVCFVMLQRSRSTSALWLYSYTWFSALCVLLWQRPKFGGLQLTCAQRW